MRAAELESVKDKSKMYIKKAVDQQKVLQARVREVCCSVLKCVTVLQCVCNVLQRIALCHREVDQQKVLQVCVCEVCCSVLQLLQCCNVLQ